ncbi:MAG: NCS2 family permease [Firmicutes bacterium]|nr:NCS2 family permease [Bacillota bacterium]
MEDGFLERTFHLREHGTDVRTEVVAGITTFMTMAYIIFVNPSIVQETGMPFAAVMYATIASSVLATVLMAFLANYPFALAPGMGLNAYFTYSVVLGMGMPWQTALGAVFISGVVFTILTFTKVREAIIDAVPATLKNAIGAGIGLFIAFIGFKNAQFVVPDPATYLGLGVLTSPGALVAAIGLFITGVLLARGVRGGILWGILISTAIGIPFGVTQMPQGIIQWPRFSLWAPVLFKLDIRGALSWGILDIVFAFLFVDMFDTVGTLIGVSARGGFLDKDGRLPRAEKALLADSLGTIAGSFFGTPTVTTYVESASGVAAGGKTGLTALVTAAMFVLSLFFLPIVSIVPEAATAPALIIVGAMMMGAITSIDWNDLSEAIPALITAVGMPFTFSIANGIAFGFISYSAIKLFSGKGKDVHWLVYVLAVLFAIRFAYLG